MRRGSGYPLLALLIWLAFPVRSPAPLVFTPGQGWRYETVGATKDWQMTRAQDQLEVAEKAFAQQDYGLAIKAAKRLVAQWPYGDYTSQAQFLLARCYEEVGKDEKAFKAYQKLIELYPKIENYDEIIHRQYAIANRFLGGQWFKLWGYIPTFPSMVKTIALFEKIVKNGPYSAVAPEAQMKIGEAYEKKFLREYPKAAQAYERAADRYHDQPVGVDAMFQVGVTYTKQAKTAEYDQSIASQAIATFSDFMTLHPNDPRVAEAQEYILALRTEQARGSFDIAKFYEGKRHWDGALIYYNEVLIKDSNSQFAEEARQRIEIIQQRRPPPK